MVKKICSLVLAVAVMSSMISCRKDTATLSGWFLGPQPQQVLLEKVTDSAKPLPADTTETDDKGRFRFRVKLPDSQAALYNLRINGETVPLFLSPGERARIHILYGNTSNYIIEGSAESALIKEINDILSGGLARLDSIARARALYDEKNADKREGLREYTREYQRIKREHIKFIVVNSGSLAAIYALYQRLPGDDVLFNGDADIIYYRMVADSVGKYHPDSPYLKTLQSHISEFEAGERLLAHINEQLENPSPFPDINLPDIYNVRRKLSDETGKAILLDFWVAGEARSAVINAEYKELYELFSGGGFEIYQVNAGTSKTVWVNAVLDQRLPWISVSDMRGGNSPALLNYNVKTLPANYLIAPDGDIVARNIYGDDLRSELERMIGR